MPIVTIAMYSGRTQVFYFLVNAHGESSKKDVMMGLAR